MISDEVHLIYLSKIDKYNGLHIIFSLLCVLTSMLYTQSLLLVFQGRQTGSLVVDDVSFLELVCDLGPLIKAAQCQISHHAVHFVEYSLDAAATICVGVIDGGPTGVLPEVPDT